MMTCKLTSVTSEPSCVLEYGVKSKEEHRTRTKIALNCNAKDDAVLDPFSVLFDHSLYTTTLHSVCSCPGRCDFHGALPQKTSTGLLIISVFVSCGVVYLVGGMIFNRIAKGARGKQMIPNLSFWMDLPFLIKDGATFSLLFCYSCFKIKRDYTAI